jgi:hypothetical protein
MKTTEQVESEETTEVLAKIDDYIFYGDGMLNPAPKAKVHQVVGTLVKLMVSKGLLSVQDVKRVLGV